jgi:hypothetical protein
MDSITWYHSSTDCWVCKASYSWHDRLCNASYPWCDRVCNASLSWCDQVCKASYSWCDRICKSSYSWCAGWVCTASYSWCDWVCIASSSCCDLVFTEACAGLREQAVLLIDGLDDADGSRPNDNAILSVVQHHLWKLPRNFRFIFTSRPMPHIEGTLMRRLSPLRITPSHFGVFDESARRAVMGMQ